MTNLIIIASAIYILCFLTFIILKIKLGDKVGLFCKALTSLCFCTFGIIFATKSSHQQIYCILAVCGLFFGMFGDIFLGIKLLRPNQKRWLNLGFASFSVQHILMIAVSGMLIGGNNLNIAVASIAPILLVSAFVVTNTFFLKKYFCYGSFLWQANGYAGVLICSTTLFVLLSAFTGMLPTLAVAMPLFLLSDLVLCAMYFGGYERSNTCFVINHTLYYAAQFLIMITLVL